VVVAGVVEARTSGSGESKRDPPTSPTSRDSLVAVEVGVGWKKTNKATNESLRLVGGENRCRSGGKR
jgi:uncharacterized protein (DUF736 family)